LLEKDPADRIQSAQALARRLRGLTGVETWSPERAEQWWETNLPNLALLPSVEDDSDEDNLGKEVTAEHVHA